jgi:phage tail tape-measure protein
MRTPTHSRLAGRSGFLLRIAAGSVAVLLAGCGDSSFDRTTTGAGTGAGTGALIGLIGGPIGVVIGAGIGAGVGAVAGGSTTSDQVDLGKPVWEDKDQGNKQAADVKQSP